jgi:hypothetical protein
VRTIKVKLTIKELRLTAKIEVNDSSLSEDINTEFINNNSGVIMPGLKSVYCDKIYQNKPLTKNRDKSKIMAIIEHYFYFMDNSMHNALF